MPDWTGKPAYDALTHASTNTNTINGNKTGPSKAREKQPSNNNAQTKLNIAYPYQVCIARHTAGCMSLVIYCALMCTFLDRFCCTTSPPYKVDLEVFGRLTVRKGALNGSKSRI